MVKARIALAMLYGRIESRGLSILPKAPDQQLGAVLSQIRYSYRRRSQFEFHHLVEEPFQCTAAKGTRSEPIDEIDRYRFSRNSYTCRPTLSRSGQKSPLGGR